MRCYDVFMRTTVRIDDDLLLELKERSRREKLSLAGLVNRLLRRGLRASDQDRQPARRFRERAVSMGRPAIDLDKALALASGLEDEEVLRKLSLRK
jgi:hypothetical protein